MSEHKTLYNSKRNTLFYMDMSFIFLMLCAVLFAFWKCRYGFGGYDEAFYIATPQRFSLGDAVLCDEWNKTQLAAVLTTPLYWLYTTITGGTTGIILAARYAYTTLHLFVCILIYARLRKYGFGAVAASVLFFVFTPYNLMTLSYNTMGIDLTAVSGVLLATADYRKKLVIILSGIAFAGAVLCQPYLMIAYLIFALCVVANIILKKLKKDNLFTEGYFSLRTFLFFTLGAAAVAVVFAIFVLSRASISEIITNLNYILNSGSGTNPSVSSRMSYYFTTMWKSSNLFRYSIIVYLAILLVMIIDRKRRKHRGLYLLLTAAVVIFAYTTYFPKLTTSYYNYIMFPAIYLGISSYILSENKHRNLLVCIFALGIIYTFCANLGSNQYYYIVSAITSITNIASFLFLGNVLNEMRNEKRDENEKKFTILTYTTQDEEKSVSVSLKRFISGLAIVLCIFTILFQAGLQVTVKANHCFWESSMDKLNVTLSGGPGDGIITSTSSAQTYQNRLYDVVQTFGDKHGENTLMLTQSAWTYLAAEDMNFATYSSWIGTDRAKTLKRLQLYYSVHPDKVPKYIYIPTSTKFDAENIIAEATANGYTLKESVYSYLLVRE